MSKQVRMDKVLKAYTANTTNPTVEGFAAYWKVLNECLDVTNSKGK